MLRVIYIILIDEIVFEIRARSWQPPYDKQSRLVSEGHINEHFNKRSLFVQQYRVI